MMKSLRLRLRRRPRHTFIISLATIAISSLGCRDNKEQQSDGGRDGLQFTDVSEVDAPPPDLQPDLQPDLPSDLPPPDLPPDVLPDVLPPDVCVPIDCTGRQCGGDLCGGTCGSGCSAAELCVDGQCVDKVVDISVAGEPELVWEYDAGVFCAFPDGPVRMFRDTSGRAIAIISSVNSYRLESTTTDGEFTVGAATAPKQIFKSPQNTAESAYNAMFWLDSVWTDDGLVIYALAHHEWYPEARFQVSQECLISGAAVNAQVSAVHHLFSSALGSSFKTTQPYVATADNTKRLALAPETWGSKPIYPSGEVRYGFGRPSNIVKDGPYFYVVVATEELVRNTPGGTDYVIPYRTGFVMLRTTDISSGWSNGLWEMWSGSAWQPVNGVVNNGDAHIFTHDGAHAQPRTELSFSNLQLEGRIDTMSYSLTFNTVASRWVLLGHTGNGEYLYFTSSATLSNPQWTDIQPVGASDKLVYNGAVHPKKDATNQLKPDWNGAYPAVIDHGSAGKVFMYTADSPMLYYVRTNSATDRDIFRVQLSISVK